MKNIKFGWIRDLPDKRDFMYGFSLSKRSTLDTAVNLVSGMPYVYDQGRLGSCTAQAMAAVYQFTLKENKNVTYTPSRLKIYYDERTIEGTVKYDSGATLRSGMKVLAKYGVCPETLWTYNDRTGMNAKFKKKPSKKCYNVSKKHKALKYYRVAQREHDLCSSLTLNDPIVFGFAVFESFYSNDVTVNGNVPMPNYNRESMLGGHAVCLVGYNLTTRKFLVRNSWGKNWGLGGYFTMPFDYVLDPHLSADFWALKIVK